MWVIKFLVAQAVGPGAGAHVTPWGGSRVTKATRSHIFAQKDGNIEESSETSVDGAGQVIV